VKQAEEDVLIFWLVLIVADQVAQSHFHASNVHLL
jgi:hypothetical protein